MAPPSIDPPGVQSTILAPELVEAVETASPEFLRKLILNLCSHESVARDFVAASMLVPASKVVSYDAHEDNAQNVDNKKRKATEGPDSMRPRWATCEHCNVEFDVTENQTGACQWHDGRKETNFETDFWADHDPNCHGEYSDFEDDEDFAEGFIWWCCGGDGATKGCKVTKHKATEWRNKKMRY